MRVRGTGGQGGPIGDSQACGPHGPHGPVGGSRAHDPRDSHGPVGGSQLRGAPRLCLVVPCYDEEAVLPETAPAFQAKVASLVAAGAAGEGSVVLYVDDGSSDATWDVIEALASGDPRARGLRLSRNFGHQRALLAGLMEARRSFDVAVSIDCDGQDDIGALDEMLRMYREGCDVVYGVRSDRSSDGAFKRLSAGAFYGLLRAMGVEAVSEHADYRLMSARALDALSEFGEANLFLRGLVPMVGYKSGTVEYERRARVAGKSHYPLGKMVSLAIDGITSLSVKPLRMISAMGVVLSLASVAGIAWAAVAALTGNAVPGWASLLVAVLLVGGLQLLALGVIGEYVGRIYLEAKGRPRYIVEESVGCGGAGRPAGAGDAREAGGAGADAGAGAGGAGAGAGALDARPPAECGAGGQAAAGRVPAEQHPAGRGPGI